MKPNFTYVSPESELEDLDLGALGMATWTATVFAHSGTYQVVKATATYFVDEIAHEIDVTEFVKRDYECKEWIRRAYEKQCERELEPDPDRLYDEFVDREREGA